MFLYNLLCGRDSFFLFCSLPFSFVYFILRWVMGPGLGFLTTKVAGDDWMYHAGIPLDRKRICLPDWLPAGI